jgi:hypothetical protein
LEEQIDGPKAAMTRTKELTDQARFDPGSAQVARRFGASNKTLNHLINAGTMPCTPAKSPLGTMIPNLVTPFVTW